MVSLDQVRDVREARVPVVSEAERAEHLRSRGRRVIEHRSRFWQEARPGFYRPVNHMARLSAEEATCPTLACWGFQARLTERDTHRANASIPTYLISDLARFDEECLPKGRRNSLRRARERARLVELTGPDLLREQGYEVLVSARRRTGYGKLPSRQSYLAALDDFGNPAAGIVVAGIVDGKLGGYLTGHAVDGTAYALDGVVATWALRSNISAGLFYEFIYACRRTNTITEIFDGLHVREDEGLCRNKELNGIPLVGLPARLFMIPGATGFLRRATRHKYYRLTGRG
jgi:hypothetical protein